MKYAAKRIAMLLVTMVIVSLLAFVAFDLISGDPATAMLGTAATPEKVAALRAELGLDRPLLVRYGEWLVGFFTGNLGISYSYGQPVWELISSKVLVTLVLSLMSFVLIVAVSIPLGLRSAVGGGKLEGQLPVFGGRGPQRGPLLIRKSPADLGGGAHHQTAGRDHRVLCHKRTGDFSPKV